MMVHARQQQARTYNMCRSSEKHAVLSACSPFVLSFVIFFLPALHV